MSKIRPGHNRKLTEEQRIFIVQRLACYDSPKEVADALRDRFGVEITPQGVERYDPTKWAGRNLTPKYRELFERTRSRFLERLEDIPESHKAVRIRKLARAARALEERGNYAEMADMLEQIAKELGNVYSNRRELTGRDGEPVQFELRNLTDEQLNLKLSRLLAIVDIDDEEGADAGGASPAH